MEATIKVCGMTGEKLLRGILGGVFISLGGFIYLTVGGPVGAALFSIGLLSVIHFGALLYTGKVRDYSPASDNEKFISTQHLAMVLLLNVVGCIVMTALMAGGDVHLHSAEAIVAKRAAMTPIELFGRAVCCGMIMTAAVSAAKEKNNFWPLLIGVPGFILAGFIHSIADAFYISVAWKLLSGKVILSWVIAVIGNFVGGLIPVWLTAFKNR